MIQLSDLLQTARGALVVLPPGVVHAQAGLFVGQVVLVGQGTTIVVAGEHAYGLWGRETGLVNVRVDARRARVDRAVYVERNARTVSDVVVLGGRVACLAIGNSDLRVSNVRVGQMPHTGSGSGYGLLLENCTGLVSGVRPSGSRMRHMVTVVGGSNLTIRDAATFRGHGFAAVDLHGRGDRNTLVVRAKGRINVGNDSHPEGTWDAVLAGCFGRVVAGRLATFRVVGGDLAAPQEAAV